MNWLYSLLNFISPISALRERAKLLETKIENLKSENAVLKTQKDALAQQLADCKQQNEKLRKRISGDDFGALVG